MIELLASQSPPARVADLWQVIVKKGTGEHLLRREFRALTPRRGRTGRESGEP